MIRTKQFEDGADVIDLGIGQPPLSLLPSDLLRRGADVRFADPDRSWLQYGPEEGDGRFRLSLADFLSRAYGMEVPAESLFITAGASQALYLICTLFSVPGDTIFVEEPSYFLALRLFADHGLRVIGLPMDEDGLIVDALEERLRHERPAFLYTVPTFQNPTGRTLSADRRRRLAELSRQYGLLVVADEVYHLLAYGAPPPLPMPAWDRAGLIVSLGSFSKILAPGLRLGWIQASPDMVARLAAAGFVKSGGGLNPFASAIVRDVVESGRQAAHIAALRSTYRRNLSVFDQALRPALGALGSFSRPDGGYFFWVHVPGADTVSLLAVARELGVAYHPGNLFSSVGGLREWMRLCFAHYGESELNWAAERLGSAVMTSHDRGRS